MPNLLAATVLVTFTCANPTLKNCTINEIGPMTESKCEKLAIHIGNTARTLQLKETVIFFCTTDVDGLLEELPFKGSRQQQETGHGY